MAELWQNMAEPWQNIAELWQNMAELWQNMAEHGRIWQMIYLALLQLLHIMDGRASYCIHAMNNRNNTIWFLLKLLQC